MDKQKDTKPTNIPFTKNLVISMGLARPHRHGGARVAELPSPRFRRLGTAFRSGMTVVGRASDAGAGPRMWPTSCGTRLR